MEHRPDAESPFLPGRLDRRVREILSGLTIKWAYPEHPGRITAICDRLQQHPIAGLEFRSGAVASREQLARVHGTSYLNRIDRLRGQSAWLDTDTTAVSPGSIEAAEVAAGTAVAAVDAVCNGEARSSFALTRPPGHHAEPVRARGFCLFNNAAIAATHAQAVHGLERVLIIDWDAHHGNGTQDIFWADPSVLFFDIHRGAPFYPGSGALEDVGAGLGEGYTVNVPMPAGSGNLAYIKAFNEILVPAVDAFRPELILVSAGFDAHRLDLALNVSYEGFAALTGIVQGLADQHCPGRLACILEGGYHLESLSGGVHAVLEVLAGGVPPEPGVTGLREVEAAAEFHRSAFRDDP
nr:histone deacetylase [Methylonatrum kenyense]